MRACTHDCHARRGSAPRAANRRAVTLVELVIVIMVMSIMTAVAAPAFLDSLVHHRVESAARRVKADLELARHTACLTSATQSVTFTAAGYTLSAGARGVDDPNQSYTVDLTATPYDLSTVTASFGNSLVVAFDGYGTPTSGGTVILTSKGTARTVSVDGVTGQVSIATNNSEPSGTPPVDAP